MFISANELKGKQIGEGVSRGVAWGERIMIAFVDLAPHSVMPSHSHPHEQMGVVLRGEFEIIIGEESRVLREGDAYLVPSGVKHSVKVLESQVRALDIFSPPSEEYK